MVAHPSFYLPGYIKYIKIDQFLVKRNRNKIAYDCHRKKEEILGRFEVLFQKSKDIVVKGLKVEVGVGVITLARPKNSGQNGAWTRERGERRAVYCELKKSGNDSFHEPTHFITEQQREYCAWFCDLFLKDWDKLDFLHVVALDKFFIYSQGTKS